MIKYLQRLKRKNGLTLVEVVISMAIFSMLLLAVFSMYQPVSDIANMVTADSDMQRVVYAGEQYVVQQLRLSPEIHIFWNGTGWPTGTAQTIRAFRQRRGADELPQALVIHEGRLYNVRLRDVTISPGTDIDGILTSFTTPQWRVFNESFYNGVHLDFEMALTPIHPQRQVRGNTWLQMQVDGRRACRRTNHPSIQASCTDCNAVDMNSRRLSDTQLTWIGHVGGVGPPTAELRARLLPDIDTHLPGEDCTTVGTCNCVASGSFIILYLGKMDFTRVLDDMMCEPTAAGGCGQLLINCTC
jgi:prepilin-type N-terminal cleavage/methylation domain-containing protein